MVFQVNHPDYTLSPFTGMTRKHWLEAGEYLLQGIFQHIKTFDDPVVVPRQETAITYPHSADAVWEHKAEYFEGLARSFFIAAPMIHNCPEMEVCGYSMREYYKAHVLRSCTKGDPQCVGHFDELVKLTGESYRTFQQTVETCALVICLWVCKEEIWDTYSKEEKDRIADFLLPFAHGYTVPQNWRLFNMLDMAFLNQEGYSIDEAVMLEHAQAILDYYAGDGWYRDGHSFDYYSCWAFNVYTPIWNLWYGYEHMPYIAQRFEEISNELMRTYPDFFDRDGFTNMWGRSNIYRNAATSAFEGNLLLRNSTVDAGLARRISSGSLLQFLTREDFLRDGIPTLGFYRQFAPLVQGYSCAESPFWLGKAFLCLHLPEDHPFWTAKENNGTWDILGPSEVKVTALDGPALCFSNHQANGETILRTGKVLKQPGDEHGMWNYAKLCYNTKYPWEAKPAETIEAQQYVLKDLVNGSIEKGNATFWSGQRDGVLYRRQFFNYRLDTECHWLNTLDLADFVVPDGIMRVDKLRLYGHPMSLTLGAYGFPDNGTEVIQMEWDGAQAIILKGYDAVGREKQLAMTVYDGWERLDIRHSQGTNPDSERSIIVYGATARRELYRNSPYILISQVITRESREDFTADEIFPIRSITYSDPRNWGSFGPIVLAMKNGQQHVVDFGGLEGCLQM